MKNGNRTLSVVVSVVVLLLVMFSGMTEMVLSAESTPVEQCKLEINYEIRSLAGLDPNNTASGALNEVENLFSTSTGTYLLIGRMKDLLIRKRLEFKALCEAVSKFKDMTVYEQDGFSISSCAREAKSFSIEQQFAISAFCTDESVKALKVVMDSVEGRMMRDAMEDGVELLIETFRRINGKLPTLLDEYSRLVQNFFTLHLRLGPHVIRKYD